MPPNPARPSPPCRLPNGHDGPHAAEDGDWSFTWPRDGAPPVYEAHPVPPAASAAERHACEHCGGTLWEDAEDGGRCIGCGKRPLYTMRRADGWPLCPHCENDELYSLHVPATIRTICGCYACGWMPPLKGLRIVDPA